MIWDFHPCLSSSCKINISGTMQNQRLKKCSEFDLTIFLVLGFALSQSRQFPICTRLHFPNQNSKYMVILFLPPSELYRKRALWVIFIWRKKNVSKFVEGFTLILANNGTYSRTYNNQSPCIERLVVKVPKLLPLICCKFQLYKAFTSIKRSWSLFTESQRPFCTAFHLRWTGT